MQRLIALIVLAGLAACATPTPYQPAPAPNREGFVESRIESNRLSIAFRGNSLTPRETVETYLLHRAAEATLENGFDHFVVADRATDVDARTVSIGRPIHAGFSPRYWAWSPRFGWVAAYDPFFDPFDRSVETRQVTRFEARAEIAMFKGPKPAADPQAFDARETLANLAPKIVRPTPR